MPKTLTPRYTEVRDLAPADKNLLQIVAMCEKLLNHPDDESAIASVRWHVQEIRDVVELQKRLEHACKVCKELTEPALWLIAEDNEVKDMDGRPAFKFSSVGKIVKISDQQGLKQKLLESGYDAEQLLEIATLAPKDTAELLGMSAKAFEDNFAEFLEISNRKPTMKAV